MIKCVFTLDYEIYGGGEGTLRELVLEPTQELAEIFGEFRIPFVVFAEAVEFQKMEQFQSDSDIRNVGTQLRDLRMAGHEIALHLHPWWANARYRDGRWDLDWDERNIAALSEQRVEGIVSDAIDYLRRGLKDSSFSPVSFRSGLLAMQPTAHVAQVLVRHGIKVDSSLFKGGRVQRLGLDYRRAAGNGGYWRFGSDINTPESDGPLLEIPIHTRMVPAWRMLGSKRLKLQKKTRNSLQGTPLPHDWRDFLRFRYPKKLDFCRMTFEEMRETMQQVLGESQLRPEEPRVVVAIGHSKDFMDGEATRRFLRFLKEQSVSVTTFSRLVARGRQELFS